jgi:ribosome-binding factor A
MSSRRIARINEQLRREVAEILQYEVKDPRIGSVTVTAARVTPDLQLARVFVTAIGDAPERRETLAGLTGASAFIRSALADRLDLRRVPELRFELDESLSHAMRIEQLLSEVLPEDSPSGAADDAVSEASGTAEDEADAGSDRRGD